MMSLDQFIALCQARRSIRYFADEHLSLDEVKRLLHAAEASPSVDNTKPWHFHVIANPQLRTKLMEASCYGNFIGGSSVFLVVTCDKGAKPRSKDILWNPRELEYSCVAAMEHVLLAATAHGIGSCWVSLHHGIAHDMLTLEDHHTVIGGIMLGRLRTSEEVEEKPAEPRDVDAISTIHE